jgi:hypothetical protein
MQLAPGNVDHTIHRCLRVDMALGHLLYLMLLVNLRDFHSVAFLTSKRYC